MKMRNRLLIVSVAVVVTVGFAAIAGWILLKLGFVNERQFEFMLWISAAIGILVGLSKTRRGKLVV